MPNASTLAPPELPQMVNDGYITEAELQSDGAIIVNVPRYTNAAKGDYLCLYFDGELFNTLSLPDPDTYLWPWPSKIQTSGTWPADGPHQVWYTATDAAQNPSTSPVSAVIVDRQHTSGLPPPTFPDADATNTITYDSVLQNNGTYVKVPWSTNAFNNGDTIYVYWRELDVSGNPVASSATSITHTVTSSDVGNGFKVLISSPFVTAIATTGSAEAWYSVIPLTGTAQSSQAGSVKVDMTGSGIYPAPVIPAGNDGWIDCGEITVSGVEIDVPASTQFVAGGGVVVYWQGYDVNGVLVPSTAWQSPPHSLAPNEVTAGFSVMVPAAYITPVGIGSAQAWYTVTAPAVPGVSGVASVLVDSQHCTLLPPPVFPAAAGDNTITGDEVTAGNGTDMDITYPGMMAGDIVTTFWTGYLTTPDTPVPGATWTQTRTLNTTEEQTRQAIFHVPADNIIPVGNGHGEGRYQVMYKSSGIASSGVTDVNVSASSASSLLMNCTTGAPVFDPTVLVRPMNTVFLSGTPGADVELSLQAGSDAWFNPDGVQTLQLRLDVSGTASAQVYSFTPGNVLVSAYVITNPALSASQSMTFTGWLSGPGDLVAYGASTGAIANGRCVCSVYLQTSATSVATQARLALTAPTSALILVSGTTTAFVNVSTSHAGGFDVTDAAAESVTFTLSLPDTGNYVQGTLIFSGLSQAFR
ncbi:hypothetical protein L8P27_16810 [Enterobacter asburiae]|uniref:hypothetical protein n=1 Tax=Enterobacter asburiae TaxID=61645 RepID=UPI00200333B2|nr:hypothetical protein [Enterobacter asburiae]MCK7229468.1 hypothetical protein [Enterobacter asburiae]